MTKMQYVCCLSGLLWLSVCGDACSATPGPNAIVAGACAIVDTAKEACTVIRYLDAAGKEAEVRVSREEMREFGREVAVRRAAVPAAASGGTK